MVLLHIIDSEVVPVVRLTEVFRQAAHSRTITTAHRINEGHMPELSTKNAQSDFYFIDRAEPDQIADTLVDMVKARIVDVPELINEAVDQHDQHRKGEHRLAAPGWHNGPVL
jgi:ATP-dependent exoDNAse (exonuclease V) alpha subunit